MEEHQIGVIGAGVAGLCAARTLHARGLDVVVVESGDRVGGRVTTEEVDGFLVDRGFQVLNPAYRHLFRDLDRQRLGLRPFPRAVAVRTVDGLKELADPTRQPAALLGDLASGLIGPRDARAALVGTRLARRDEPRQTAFDRAGFDGPLRHQVVEPFLSGVVCERDGSTSARFVSWLGAMFAAGTPGLPTGGMRRLGERLADDLDVRTNCPVTALETASGVVTTAHGELRGQAVVVAAGPGATASLTGQPAPAVHGTRTFWFATDSEPTRSAAIHVDGRGRGPVATTVVVSHTAPEYAPAGQHLVAALTLTDDEVADETAARAHCGEIYGIDTSGWRTVAVHDVAETVPTLHPPFRPQDRIRLDGRTVSCGDQFGNASLDGAASSGQAAAEAVVRLLGR